MTRECDRDTTAGESRNPGLAADREEARPHPDGWAHFLRDHCAACRLHGERERTTC